MAFLMAPSWVYLKGCKKGLVKELVKVAHWASPRVTVRARERGAKKEQHSVALKVVQTAGL